MVVKEQAKQSRPQAHTERTEHRYHNKARLGKLEFPRFNGECFTQWLYKSERFFEYDETPDDEKLRIVVIHLDGDALEWHRGFLRSRTEEEGPMAWEEYVRAMNARFNQQAYDDPMADLANLTQLGTLQEYIKQFDSLLNRVQISTAYSISLFLRGLKGEIQHVVRPQQLHAAYAIARLQEAAYASYFEAATIGGVAKKVSPTSTEMTKVPHTVSRQLPSSFSSAINSSLRASEKGLLPTPTNVKPLGSAKPEPTKSVKSWFSKEMDEKRAKGLCFWCDEKYSPTHKCPKKQLYRIEAHEVEQEEGEPEMEVENIEESNPEISIHALTGMQNFQTMPVQGSVGKKVLQILIDIGSTHNFLNTATGQSLGCVFSSVAPVKVTAANGSLLTCQAQCKYFCWKMQGECYMVDVLLIELDTYDMVLGVQWLAQLSDITWNFNKLKMKFQYEGREHTLSGMPKPGIQLVDSEGLSKALVKNEQVAALQIWRLEGVSCFNISLEKSPEPIEAVDSLLLEYQDIFEEPRGLPPSRTHDHRIVLKEGASPVNSRTYRHPAVQKDVIEQMVGEMLRTGVIRNSASSFTSSVILVKKKDHTWRMCIDYRALNNITLKDKFPIPLIEELLDELHGSVIFSKLDLRSGYHQIRMAKQDVHKTVFKTHKGHYEFLVMPFGLTNAPSTFQSLMNQVFKPYLRRFVLVFFNDILVYSPSLQHHLTHLRTVLQTLREHQLLAKRSKCSFGASQVDYLGYLITKHGVSTNPAKVAAVLG